VVTGAVDDLGSPVAVPQHRDGGGLRVVSLVPSLTETLTSWGVMPVGITDYCTGAELPGAVRVRGTKNPDLDAIIGLAPDLVVANREENRRIDVERLRDAGVAVWVTAPDCLAEVCTSFESLGDALGVGGPAAGLATEIRAAIAGRIPSPERTVFCPVWRDPWVAVGTGTIAADMLRLCGLVVVPNLARYPRVELSEIARLDPDVVVLPDEPYRFTEHDRVRFESWRAEVHLIDGADLTWWGPRTPGALDRLRRLVGVHR
jgi:ABC-type Fe3+-hydroxamate transport system substrate-binding protein